MSEKEPPGLYGISYSNRDFNLKDSWGKNQFNNTFPVGLLNYMHAQHIEPVYLKVNTEDFSIIHTTISVPSLFGIDSQNDRTYFFFEEKFRPYADLVTGSVPRADLVIEKVTDDIHEREQLVPLEIKLTALPDKATSHFSEEDYGSEIVVRPDTIVYLALSFTAAVNKNREVFEPYFTFFNDAIDWHDPAVAASHLTSIITDINQMMVDHPEMEVPIMVQPIWKTVGTTGILADQCLDVFVWSNFALTRLFFNVGTPKKTISRHNRAIIWLGMMLQSFKEAGAIDHKRITDTFTYNTRNDKAFACSGLKTREFMRCPELRTPRISRAEIKNIILNGGETMLAPERRFDGAVQNMPALEA